MQASQSKNPKRAKIELGAGLQGIYTILNVCSARLSTMLYAVLRQCAQLSFCGKAMLMTSSV